MESIAITDRDGLLRLGARPPCGRRNAASARSSAACCEVPDGTAFPVLCATRDGYRRLSRHLTDLHLTNKSRSLISVRRRSHRPDRRPRRPGVPPLLRDDRKAALKAAERW